MTHTFTEVAQLHARLSPGRDQFYLVGLRRPDSDSDRPTYAYAAADWHGNVFAWQGWFRATNPSTEPQPPYALGSDPLWSSTIPKKALDICNDGWMETDLGEYFSFEDAPGKLVGNLLSTHFGDVRDDVTLTTAIPVAALPLENPSLLSAQLEIRHSEAAVSPIGMNRRWAGDPSYPDEELLFTQLSAAGAWPSTWTRP